MAEPETLYLVDDDSALREALALRLQLAGYRVRAFPGPTDFLRQVDLDSPGCLILDLQMPDMSGLELLRIMHARHATLPVIMLSGYCDRQSRARSLELGAVAVLDKPVQAERLFEIIDRAIARDRAARFA